MDRERENVKKGMCSQSIVLVKVKITDLLISLHLLWIRAFLIYILP